MKGTNRNWANLAFVIAMIVAMVVGPVNLATAQQAADQKVDVNLKDADLVTATRALTERTGLQFVIEPSSKSFARITLHVTDVTADDAVRYICEAAGATYRRDENGVYVIGHASDFPAPSAPPLPKPTEKVVRRIQILKADAADVYHELLFGAVEEPNGWKLLKKFGQTTLGGINGGSLDLSQVANQRTYPVTPSENGSMPLTGAETGNDIKLPGDNANQIGGFGGGGQGGIGGGIGGGQGGIGGGLGGGQGGLGGGAGGAQLTGGQGLVGSGIDFITYDPTTNSLIVRGTEDDIAKLQSYVNLFDVAPQQVEIKVEYVTTTETLDRALGYEFQYNRTTVFAGEEPGSFAENSNPVYLNYATGNVVGRLRAALSEGTGKVITTPIVRTLNNQPALFTSFITTYFFIPQTVATGSVFQTTYQPVPITVGTTLAVAPRINQDGTITMYLQPSVGNITGFSTSPDGSKIPNIAIEAAAIVARVKDNQTIVLGGLNTNSTSDNVQSVPILADLPIIGQFFRSTSDNKTSNELLVFVTPHIIHDDSGSLEGP